MSVKIQAGLPQQNAGLFRHILAAVAGSLLAFAVVCIAGAKFLVLRGSSGLLATPVAFAALAVGALCAGWLLARMQGHGALFCAGAGFLLYGLLPAAAGFLCGASESVTLLWIRVLAVLLASLAGGLFGLRSHTKRKRVV